MLILSRCFAFPIVFLLSMGSIWTPWNYCGISHSCWDGLILGCSWLPFGIHR